MAKICIPLANGFEEIEAVTLIDVLRRAGNDVSVIGVEGLFVEGVHKIVISADRMIESCEADEFDAIVLAGGKKNSLTLSTHARIHEFLHFFDSHKKLIGAICAAPLVLEKAGVLKEIYTCYPGIQESIEGKHYEEHEGIVECDNVMTSRGPATAMNFALALVNKLNGISVYTSLKKSLLA